MKFGKSLSNQIEQTLPEWRDKFLSYKELKKRIKLIGSKTGDDRPVKRLRLDSSFTSGDDFSVGMSKEEINFIQLLEDELEKFNNFFVEKEEEYIIRLKVINISNPILRFLPKSFKSCLICMFFKNRSFEIGLRKLKIQWRR